MREEMLKWMTRSLLLVAVLLLVACGGAAEQAAPTVAPAAEAAPAETAGADLSAVKDYALDNSRQMKAGTAALAETAAAYYELVAAHNFDYAAAWAADGPALAQLVADAKTHWTTAHTSYELDEGIIAGVPSLAFYDVWIDAGPSAAEDPTGAYEWTLELPDGRSLPSPGNIFHSLLEPIIWGTRAEFVGLPVDLDGDGATALGEVLPEANVLLAAARSMDGATGEMLTTVENWQPTLSDAFTALAVMIPTMNEYFEQWKLSTYVAEEAEETAFVGVSRLFDINGILAGLDFTYSNLATLVQTADPTLHAQIADGFTDLRGYVGDLYQQEQNGVRFTPAQADLFGGEAQAKATALAGQVSQAAALLNVTIAE